MLKQLPPKMRIFVISSVVINMGLILYITASFLVGWYVETSGALDKAEYNAINDRLCRQNYQRILDDIDQQFPDDPKRAADTKNSFAINVCLRNYKTGEKLDLQPLVDQVK